MWVIERTRQRLTLTEPAYFQLTWMGRKQFNRAALLDLPSVIGPNGSGYDFDHISQGLWLSKNIYIYIQPSSVQDVHFELDSAHNWFVGRVPVHTPTWRRAHLSFMTIHPIFIETNNWIKPRVTIFLQFWTKWSSLGRRQEDTVVMLHDQGCHI